MTELLNNLIKACVGHFGEKMEYAFEKELEKNGFEKIDNEENSFIVKTYKRNPNGSQQHPDFAIYTNSGRLEIELKSSATTKHITWNSGFPRKDTIYFLNLPSINKDNPVIAFIGKEFSGNIDVFDEIKDLPEIKLLTDKINKMLPDGWSYYCRHMFNQSSSHIEVLYNNKDRLFRETAELFDVSEEDENYYNIETVNYSVEDEYRSLFGQFFTPKKISNNIVSMLKKYIKDFKNIMMLEPSFGTGELIQISLNLKIKKENITGVELDTSLYNLISPKYHGCKFHNADFLLLTFTQKYNLILANPPYVELKHIKDNFPDKYQRYIELYADVLHGRSNIYIAFVSKMIDLLEENGIMILIIPSSIQSSSSTILIREKIKRMCSVLDFVKFDRFSQDICQDIMILLLQKTSSPDGKYFNRENNITKDKDENQETLKSFGCEAHIGKIVWNQHKSILSETPSNYILLRSENISNNNTFQYQSDNEEQYLTKNIEGKNEMPPFLLVNRTVGTNSAIKSCLIDMNTFDLKQKIYCENHTIVLTHKRKVLDRVHKTLCDPRTKEYLIKNRSGSSMTISQLLSIPMLY